MENVVDRVAFVTGGASGIGLGIAHALVEAGAKVCIADIITERLNESAWALRQLGGEVHAIKLDVSDRAGYSAAADEVEAVLGPVDILCNNAGVGILEPIHSATYDDWDWVLGVNLGGVVNGLRTFLPRMLSGGRGGHVVTTASLAGLTAGESGGIYTPTKMAVVGMMEALRGEVAAFDVGVSVLCPHFVRTNAHEHRGLRPSRFGGAESPAAGDQVEALDSALSVGMDPVEVGYKVLAGIKADRLYILTHPEIESAVRERFRAILAAIPDEPVDAARLSAEQSTLHYWVYEEQAAKGALGSYG